MATNGVLDRLEALLAAATPGTWHSLDGAARGVFAAGVGESVLHSRAANLDLIAALRNAAPALIRLARAAAALDACHDLNFAPGWMTKQAACKLEHEAAIKALGEVRL